MRYLFLPQLVERIEILFTGNSLTEAARYYGKDKERILRISLNKSLIIGATVTLSILPMNPLLGIALGVASFLAYLSRTLNHYPNILRREKTELEIYGTAFLETFSTTLIATESILRAITSVSNQEIPRISDRFRRITKRIENGENPENLILRFADSLPSQTLRMSIIRIVTGGQRNRESMRRIVETTERMIRRQYEELTAQMESRITVIFAIDFFVPTMIMISASMLGYARSPLIFLLIPFHLCLIDLAQAKITEVEEKLIW